MSDTVDGSSAHLAAAAKAVTKAVEAAWLVQQKMGEGIGPEVRDALIALVTERSPRAKVRMISERPELTDNAAERLIDHAIALVRALPAADASYVRFFESHLVFIRQVRTGAMSPGDVPAEPLPDAAREKILADRRSPGSQRARDHDERARLLRERGQVEDAAAEFTKAVRRARAEGDAATEGSAELGLFTLMMRTAPHRHGNRRQMLEHARRAAEAYRRAGDQIGERDAVVAMIGVLTDLADKPNLGIALQRLAGLDENHARWWQAYSTAMHADRLAERISGLRWCIESAHLLDDHAEFYRKMCAGKLAFFENRAVPLNDRDSDAFQGAVTTYDVMSNGPTKDAAKQLDKILERIEQIRKYARSQTLQRELSDTHQVTYRAAALCAEALRSPEDAVDVIELASSRALLAQTGMPRLWRQLHPQIWEDSRSEALQKLFGRFTSASTVQNRRLLMKSFDDQRQALQRQAQAPVRCSRICHRYPAHVRPRRTRVALRRAPSSHLQCIWDNIPDHAR